MSIQPNIKTQKMVQKNADIEAKKSQKKAYDIQKKANIEAKKEQKKRMDIQKKANIEAIKAQKKADIETKKANIEANKAQKNIALNKIKEQKSLTWISFISDKNKQDIIDKHVKNGVIISSGKPIPNDYRPVIYFATVSKKYGINVELVNLDGNIKMVPIHWEICPLLDDLLNII